MDRSVLTHATTQVSRPPARVIQRCGTTPPQSCPCHDEGRAHHEERDGEHGTGTRAPAIVHAVLASPGEPLDTTSRALFEARLGHDFGRVRVHRGARPAESARAIGAVAYTAGTHIVLAAAEPSWRVMAHELTHVIQQGFPAGVPEDLEVGGPAELEEQADGVADRVVRGSTAGVLTGARQAQLLVQRQRPTAGTAAAAPRLDVRPSTNGPPCACLVFIHNNERNARLTAELMHNHCRYNLTIMTPDTGQRRIQLPRHGGDVDPNELFPRAVAEQCSADEQACRDFLTQNANSTNPTVIEGVVHRQFYLAINDCSNRFRIPVVALHNNAIDDTARYRARQAAVDATDVPRGVFERVPRPRAPGA
ncbi:MAG TPA: DUF4157 domain-containing protein, partial [Micromonosporaceae bacterium]|nr:DUF4157 domain-containing protein [Micromonosporaceae bacterium]